MKTVTLYFSVPDDVETTSENLAHAKQLLLDALSHYAASTPLSEADDALAVKILTES
jgi:hypothetical protein